MVTKNSITNHQRNTLKRASQSEYMNNFPILLLYGSLSLIFEHIKQLNKRKIKMFQQQQKISHYHVTRLKPTINAEMNLMCGF